MSDGAKYRGLANRLRLQPEDLGGPSRIEMLRERSEAADRIEALEAALQEARASQAQIAACYAAYAKPAVREKAWLRLRASTAAIASLFKG